MTGVELFIGRVIALVVVMAIFLWAVDVGLMWAVKMLMGRSA